MSKRVLVIPSASIKSDACRADWRSDPTPKHSRIRDCATPMRDEYSSSARNLESGNARDAGAAYEFLLTGCCILDGSIVDLFGVGMEWT